MTSTGAFTISGNTVGVAHKPLIIAEVAQAHDGSLGAAHAFIDIASECKADAIKFQTHIAAAESTRDEPFRVAFSKQDATRYAYWQRMQFTPAQWAGLAAHAREKGLIFLSSPFSLEAVALLEQLDVPAWKVASGEIQHLALLDAMLATDKPLLLSSGMSAYAEIDQTVAYLREKKPDVALALFQCTTQYPTPYTEVGLNVLSVMQQRYQIPVGLSDHSADVLPSIVAMALGASLIEVHLALHPGQFGPDTVASLLPSQLKELCRARDVLHTLQTHPVDKDAMAVRLKPVAQLFERSLALKQDEAAGTVLTADKLTLKKPGSGLSPADAKHLLGQRLTQAVPCDRLLTTDDVSS